jgi:hypothetical protein
MISYVRPGAKLILTCQCSSYFGSGFGMVRLTLTGGATRGAITRAAQDNGLEQLKEKLIKVDQTRLA